MEPYTFYRVRNNTIALGAIGFCLAVIISGVIYYLRLFLLYVAKDDSWYSVAFLSWLTLNLIWKWHRYRAPSKFPWDEDDDDYYYSD